MGVWQHYYRLPLRLSWRAAGVASHKFKPAYTIAWIERQMKSFDLLFFYPPAGKLCHVLRRWTLLETSRIGKWIRNMISDTFPTCTEPTGSPFWCLLSCMYEKNLACIPDVAIDLVYLYGEAVPNVGDCDKYF